MLFFSSLGFKVLENAISVIFLHRVELHKRHFIVSLLLPFGYNIFIATVLFAGSFLIIDLIPVGGQTLMILGHSWSLEGVSTWLMYIAGVLGEALLISAIYYFMPVGMINGTPCIDRRRLRDIAVGSCPTCTRMVFWHAVSGECGLRLAHHGHHSVAQP